MLPATSLVLLGCLATLTIAFPADDGVEIVPSIDMSDAVAAAAEEEDSYRRAANPAAQQPQAPHDPEGPDHALAPPPADHVAPAARAFMIVQEQPELVREKRQFGYGGYGGYGRRGYGRRFVFPIPFQDRHRFGGYGGYPGGYGGGYGGYPGGYGGYPGGYGGYPGGGFGGSSAQSNAQASSFSVGGGFGPFQGSISSSQASSSAGGFGFGR
ncbi:hypothetical protein B566_EDAN009181 [Ephemera danica]|nr:hypothetical protein B566_EDAN009181 [Ephemera danica]